MLHHWSYAAYFFVVYNSATWWSILPSLCTSSVRWMPTAVWILGRIASRTYEDDDNASQEWRQCGLVQNSSTHRLVFSFWLLCGNSCAETFKIETEDYRHNCYSHCADLKPFISPVTSWNAVVLSVHRIFILKKTAKWLSVLKPVFCVWISWYCCPTFTAYESLSRTSELSASK